MTYGQTRLIQTRRKNTKTKTAVGLGAHRHTAGALIYTPLLSTGTQHPGPPVATAAPSLHGTLCAHGADIPAGGLRGGGPLKATCVTLNPGPTPFPGTR